VVVFKNPLEPHTNFIKRLVGLPGEQLWVIEGNIYTRPLSLGPDDWRIARKTDRPEVQRAVWQPIYHSQFVPLDGGAKSLDRRGPTIDHLWRQPWTPVEPKQWQMDRQAFRYSGQGSGVLGFDFDAALTGRDGLYTYNQVSLLVHDLDPIEDVRVAATIHPMGPGLDVSMSTTARLDIDTLQAPRLPLTARIDASGKAQLLSVGPDGRTPRELAAGQVAPWQTDRPRRMELWFADQHASLWLDGRLVLSWAFDLSLATVRDRPALPGVTQDAPQVRIEVSGAPAGLQQVDLDRDLFYGSVEPRYFTLGHGTLDKQSALHRGSPVTIELDRFFCLGDNSPSSSDGRFWTSANPWVRLRMLDNDPRQIGVVPRDLMMGKAFFVYYPAPHAWRPDLPGLFPNFGRMRFIH
jgi:signal peptidase I